MATEYVGIDYGMGKTNRDGAFRYGVISQYEVGQAWYYESEAEYGPPCCPDCFNEVEETADFSLPDGAPMEDNEGNEVFDEYFCSICEKGVDENREDIYPEDPLGFYYSAGGYQCEQCGDDTDIFITKSPYYTHAQYCSPCAPGAVCLMNYFINSWENSGTGEKGINNPYEYPDDYKLKAADAGFPKGYCFGHDWFESGKAPYPVYSVETGEIVSP